MAQANPTLISGVTKGLLTGTALRMQREEQEDMREQRTWDRNFKQFKAAVDWSNNLPVGQRGKYLSEYMIKTGKGNEAYQGMATSYINANAEVVSEINKTTLALDKKLKTGESPTLEFMKLRDLGVPEATINGLKEPFKEYKEETKARRYNQIYGLFGQIIGEASAGGREITNDEAAQMAALSKKYPEQFQKAKADWGKSQDVELETFRKKKEIEAEVEKAPGLSKTLNDTAEELKGLETGTPEYDLAFKKQVDAIMEVHELDKSDRPVIEEALNKRLKGEPAEVPAVGEPETSVPTTEQDVASSWIDSLSGIFKGGAAFRPETGLRRGIKRVEEFAEETPIRKKVKEYHKRKAGLLD